MTVGALLIVIFRVLASSILAAYLLKRISQNKDLWGPLIVQYIFALSAALVFFLIEWPRAIQITPVLLMGFLGALSSVACYAHWRAVHISQFKTSIFSMGVDYVAISLGLIFLAEYDRLNAPTILAAGLCFFAAFLLLPKNKSTQEVGSESAHFLRLNLTYGLVWGVSIFSFRYFATELKMSVGASAISWYLGSLLGAIIASRVVSGSIAISKKSFGETALLGIAIWLSFLFGYWSYEVLPLVIVQPIFQVTEVIFPMLIGLFLFKEARAMTVRDFFGILCGAAGLVLMVYKNYG